MHFRLCCLLTRGKVTGSPAASCFRPASPADLYGDLTVPTELCAARQWNEPAVMRACGFSVRDMIESACAAALMNMCRQLAEQKGRGSRMGGKACDRHGVSFRCCVLDASTLAAISASFRPRFMALFCR